MFYVTYDVYANHLSDGFSNTKSVLAFDTRANRDSFVADEQSYGDCHSRSVTKRQARWYLDPVVPFSGKARFIVDIYDDNTPGLLGRVENCYVDSTVDYARFDG